VGIFQELSEKNARYSKKVKELEYTNKILIDRVSQLEDGLQTALIEKNEGEVLMSKIKSELKVKTSEVENKNEIINVISQDNEELRLVFEASRKMYRERLNRLDEELARQTQNQVSQK
jgi:hypothetical protein